MRVVLDALFAEGAFREPAGREGIGGFSQGVRHARQMARRIDIAGEAFGWLDAVADPLEAGCHRCREGEIWVAVGARNPALDPEAWPCAHDAETGGPIVVAPGEPRRRPRCVHVSLVGVDRGGVEHHHIRRMGDPAAEEPAEAIRTLYRS